MSEPTSSTVQAWEFGIRLKQRREELGMTVAAAGKASGLGGPNLSAIETGKRKIAAFKMPDIAKVYGLSKREMTELETLRAGADRREWFHEFDAIFEPEFIRFLGFEAGATTIRTYQSETVPGLLQTRDYAEAMIKGGGPYIRPLDVEERVNCRMLRQSRLAGEHPLHYSVVLSQAVLLQLVGGRKVMRDQLKHLITMAVGPVDIRVLPFKTGAHPLIGSSVELLSFTSPRLPRVLWQETVTSHAIVDKRSKVMETAASLDDAILRALSREDSLALMQHVRKELE
jgi:transcriptional regulator with XRE-family HTH domain